MPVLLSDLTVTPIEATKRGSGKGRRVAPPVLVPVIASVASITDEMFSSQPTSKPSSDNENCNIQAASGDASQSSVTDEIRSEQSSSEPSAATSAAP